VILQVDPSVSTLLDFRFRQHLRAERGQHGRGKNQHGRSGEDLIVRVPAGTEVCGEEGERLVDLVEPGQRWVAARGGRGGRGNACFATATNQAPQRHDPGSPGEERLLSLELRLLADVGLVGKPNAGKSTLISRLSSARPKVADYPFTTLTPHLGVVRVGDFDSFVMADIPGLIEGAHRGAGLGTRFLRHVERTSLLVHLVDVSGFAQAPLMESLRAIESELGAYRADLLSRPRIVTATKIDLLGGLPGAREALEEFRLGCEREGHAFRAISAVTGEGLDGLVDLLASTLREIRS
jgi:GTP-binding protein